MNRTWKCGGAGLVCALLLSGAGVAARGKSPQPQAPQAAAPAYTLAEYNAYQAAAADKDPTQRVADLDDFVTKFPNSALMPYVYNTYVHAYNELKNYPKVIEYADREVALGPDKVNAPSRFQALYLRTLAFNYSFSEKDANASDEATQELAAAKAGLAVLNEVPKPANQTDDQWAENKKAPTALFNYTAGWIGGDAERCCDVLPLGRGLPADDASAEPRWLLGAGALGGAEGSGTGPGEGLLARSDSKLPADRLRSAGR